MNKVYLAQVECKGENCYQFVTESFTKDYPNIKFIELLEAKE